MDWLLNLTANGFEDLDTQLPALITAIVGAGGWIMGSAISADGAVHTRFEFERKACVEIYTALMAANLELSRNSHLQLAHLCHCTMSQEHQPSPGQPAAASRVATGHVGTALVELKILPSQVVEFDRGREQGVSDPACSSQA
jgi:hypothetical protein